MTQKNKYTYIKGDFLPDYEATISVEERGFRFGDGVFETIRVEKGFPYQWDLHIERLTNGLRFLKIKADPDDLENICIELLKKNHIKSGFLRISVSRGKGSKGYLPDINGAPTIIIETLPPSADIKNPVDLWISSYRKIPKECLPAATKTMQGLNSTLARMEAAENQCFEALLLDSSDNICEGSSSNIFWVKDNILFTPSLKSGILPGTIRNAVIRLSPFKVVEKIFKQEALKQADEVFLTNTAWIVASVKSLKPGNISWSSFDIGDMIKELVLEDMG